MKSTDFIKTPIHTIDYENTLNSSIDNYDNWRRRARKLRERRWRKLVNKLAANERHYPPFART